MVNRPTECWPRSKLAFDTHTYSFKHSLTHKFPSTPQNLTDTLSCIPLTHTSTLIDTKSHKRGTEQTFSFRQSIKITHELIPLSNFRRKTSPTGQEFWLNKKISITPGNNDKGLYSLTLPTSWTSWSCLNCDSVWWRKASCSGVSPEKKSPFCQFNPFLARTHIP